MKKGESLAPFSLNLPILTWNTHNYLDCSKNTKNEKDMVVKSK
jgi:hypothetical protein